MDDTVADDDDDGDAAFGAALDFVLLGVIAVELRLGRSPSRRGEGFAALSCPGVPKRDVLVAAAAATLASSAAVRTLTTSPSNPHAPINSSAT
jgi:hypothetical protein